MCVRACVCVYVCVCVCVCGTFVVGASSNLDRPFCLRQNRGVWVRERADTKLIVYCLSTWHPKSSFHCIRQSPPLSWWTKGIANQTWRIMAYFFYLIVMNQHLHTVLAPTCSSCIVTLHPWQQITIPMWF